MSKHIVLNDRDKLLLRIDDAINGSGQLLLLDVRSLRDQFLLLEKEKDEALKEALVASGEIERMRQEFSSLSPDIISSFKQFAIPSEAHEGWRKVGDGAFAPPFGTVRVCIGCGCLVAGGPTRHSRCVKDSANAMDD